MRRGKHAPKHIRTDLTAPHANLSRVKLHSVCQVVTLRGDRICGQPATMTGRSQMVTNPVTPKHEIDLCLPHAKVMRDSYGYQITFKERAKYGPLA